MKSLLAAASVTALLALTAPAFAFDWDGFYAGVSAGYSTAHADGEYDSPAFSTQETDSDPTGWLAGGQVGFNTSVMMGLVVGVEANLFATDISDVAPDLQAADNGHPGRTITTNIDYAGSLRGRAGFGVEGFMPYLTAGVAFVHASIEADDVPLGVDPLTDDSLLWGLTVGGGVEAAVTENISIRGEYQFTGLADHTWFDGDPWSSTSSSTSHTISGGVNFYF